MQVIMHLYNFPSLSLSRAHTPIHVYLLQCCRANKVFYPFHADGLAFACRLSKRITAVSAQIKKLTHYNEQGGDTLTREAVVDLHSPNQEGNVDGMSISREIKHQAVGHLRVIKRCEDIDRLKDEMMNCVTFYYKIEQLQSIQHLTSGCTTRFNLGSLNLVQQQLRRDGMSVLELQCIFSNGYLTLLVLSLIAILFHYLSLLTLLSGRPP